MTCNKIEMEQFLDQSKGCGEEKGKGKHKNTQTQNPERAESDWNADMKLAKACFRVGERWKRAASGPGEHYEGVSELKEVGGPGP